MVEKYRTVEAFRDHFANFLSKQTQAVRDKVYWTIKLIEEVPRSPRSIWRNWKEPMDFTRSGFSLVETSSGSFVSLMREN